MTESTHSSILRRMAGQNEQAKGNSPVTSSRAVRLALTKAANDTVGLVLTIGGVADQILPLDEMLADLEDGLLLIGLTRDGQLVGLAALDMELRAAVVEMQTMGRLSAQKPENRAPTGTDKIMCDPVLAAFLAALPQALAGTSFGGWVDDIQLDDQIDSKRWAGLNLRDCPYRVVRMTTDLGVAERKADIVIALPVITVTQEPELTPPACVNWSTTFQASVNAAPARLEAHLHRFQMPIGAAQSLTVGQIVPLPGCTVNSVRLLAPDGKTIAQAKLGQVGGMRALRIEEEMMPELAELDGAPMAPPPALGMGDLMDAAPEDIAEEPVPPMSDDTPDLDLDFPMAPAEGFPALEDN
ncbi:FliM/FliN family flagellar motor C-terminal domain-containing protein [Yoonia sp. I 8.24]|uniref:FliM/FliN family flagellar motor C-terminal domain-containing protein n=1 Tax=Yoonia sp. I 8.24 TaxID=1537229 RepID=UPI001EDFF30C|nr:flagellar motor switch protein FliM [Yoonia sp. I 8.24]MCG3267343.1 FliM/FliN family flagellar motor switch protein [Yoonia sp. I 8.24]